jgi:hypothetical protein
MKKRIIVTSIIIAVVHFILTFGSLIVAYSSGMETFDNPDYQPSLIERLAERTVDVLMQPCISLWTSKNMPNVVEWVLFLGNSFLWGIAIALLINIRALTSKHKKLIPNHSQTVVVL